MTVRESDSDGGIDFFPVNASLPFFAYGVFKPGELAFLQLKELVTKCRIVQFEPLCAFEMGYRLRH